MSSERPAHGRGSADARRWTARARALLVLSIVKGEISVPEAAARNGLSVAAVGRWKRQFLAGGENALQPNKRLEAALRENEERYRILFQSGNDASFVYVLEPDGTAGRFTDVNEVVCKSLGYTREEFLRLTPLDIRAPEARGDFPAVT